VAFDFRVVSGAIRAVSTRAPDQPLPVQAKTVIRVQRDARLLAIDREYLPTATNFRNTRHVPADTGEAVTCPAVIGQRDGWLQAVTPSGIRMGMEYVAAPVAVTSPSPGVAPGAAKAGVR